jgi:hypothetical protein
MHTPGHPARDTRAERPGQLEWVLRNRRSDDRVIPLVEACRKVLQSLPQVSDPEVGRVVEALVVLADEGFREHVRIGSYERGRLTLLVRPPELTYAIRLRWLGRLQHALSGQLGGRPCQVEFRPDREREGAPMDCGHGSSPDAGAHVTRRD